MTRSEYISQANNFVEAQLQWWPEAKERYLDLGKTERKKVRIGKLEGAVQFNPARARSTTADISAKAIGERPCFLCEKNRPEEQIAIPIINGWSLLLNPFPIFPVHFTIASDQHTDQLPDVGKMVELAEKMPGFVVFFNGAKAGASAPDHLHFQAVMVDELPLMRKIERSLYSEESRLFSVKPEECGFGEDQWPFAFRVGVIHPDKNGQRVLAEMMTPTDKELVNLYAWIGYCGELRILEIPRKAHRPRCYTDKEEPLLVSPGAIDMAGILITVRGEDFNRAPERVTEILNDVAFTGNGQG